MSFDHLFIRDVEGERRIDASELPLRVGTGTDCQLRLPGPGGGPVMLLDLLDGAPFVQPFGRSDSMQINSGPLSTSTLACLTEMCCNFSVARSAYRRAKNA